MPYSQANSVVSRHELRRTHHHATCWKITRADGTVYRWTDHDTALLLADGFTYTPANAQGAARELTASFEETATTLAGAISSAEITTDDLRAGRWDDAQVDEYVVDSVYPDIGYLLHQRHWIADVSEFTSETFQIELVGLASRLRQRRGHHHTRVCENDLGDAFGQASVAGCKYDLIANSRFNLDVDSVGTQRRIFTLNDAGGPAAGEFDFGRAKCTAGLNVGLEFEIRTHTKAGADHVIELETETPFDVAVGDLFHVFIGCEGSEARCKVLGQYANNGAFPFMPSSDKLIQTPG